MKIGPVDIRVHALAYLGAIFALIIVMLTLWRSNSVGRLETFYRAPVMQTLIEDEKNTPFLEEGAAACRTLINATPEKANARLYLGTILLREGKAAEAQSIFNEIEKLGAASREEKTMAQICAGVAQFRAACADEPAKYPEAAAKAEPIFQSILEKNPGNPDALANLALARALQKPKAFEPIKALVDQALAAKSPPSLACLEQTHCLQALIAYNQSRPMDALTEYQRAQALQPFLTTLGDNQRRAMLAALLKPDLTVALRVKVLYDVQREQQKYGQKFLPSVLNAQGYSRSLLKDEPDFVKVHYDAARASFTQARSIDPKFGPAYKNLAALLEDRTAELAKSLTTSVTGINGETPQPSLWSGEQKVSVSIPDLTAISAINTVLKEEETLWDTYIGQAAQTPEEKIDGRLRQLSCVRRIAWTSAGESGQSFAAKAMNLAKELIAMGPKDANAHFAYGQVLLEKNDRLAAAKEFETAHSLGMDSPALNRIISALSGKAELTDIRPATGLRIFGAKALFRCTVRGIDMNSIKEFNMTMDGHPVAAVRAGSQILYVPQEAELSDGKHVVKISLTPTDAETKTMDAEFFVNKRPPTWSVTPSGPDIIALQPVWTIALDDLAGIDRLTLKVTLKKVSGGYSKVLINEGRYKEPSSVGKLGGTVDTASFKVSPPAELTPGDYTLDISVQNLAGIPLNDSKKYNIK